VKRISGKQMCRALEQQGWILVRTKGAHHAYKKPGNPQTIIVPVHANKDLKLGTQHGIMKDAGLTEADL
jgi:predicted RNA binding protein YcfA (HicA-like mRNA interferase family)